jgi:hypothetical protein
MKTVTLSAHVEGKSILLDEPFDLPPDAKLLITILPVESIESEKQEWAAVAKRGLQRAYSEDEPDYPISLIKQTGVQ